MLAGLADEDAGAAVFATGVAVDGRSPPVAEAVVAVLCLALLLLAFFLFGIAVAEQIGSCYEYGGFGLWTGQLEKLR